MLRTALFSASRTSAGRAAIGSDQFVCWNVNDPRRCLAPDVFVRLGTEDDSFATWKTRERGTPELAVEILSESDDWDDKTRPLPRARHPRARELRPAERARPRVRSR